MQKSPPLVYLQFMKILKTSDVVTFKAEGIEIDAVPLSYEKRAEASKFVTIDKDEVITDWKRQTFFYVKHSVKGMRGVTDYDGAPVELEFEKDGCLTDASAQEVYSVAASVRMLVPKLNDVADQRIPTLMNPLDPNKKLEGLEIIVKTKKDEKATAEK